MAVTAGLSQNLTTKTQLDDVFFDEFDVQNQPGYVPVTDPLFFRQESHMNGIYQWAEFQPPGEFEVHKEREVRKTTSPRVFNNTSKAIDKYMQTAPISSEFFDDDMHSTVNQIIRDFGRKARTTRDSEGYANTYADGFDGNNNTTPDGQSLFNNSHTAGDGTTVDNLETGALTPANLETLFTSLQLQVDQNGDYGGQEPAGLLVPNALLPDAMEITKSVLQANSAENNLNYFSEVFPGLRVGYSPFLDSTFNSATNAATSYYLVSRHHWISRVERAGITTNLVQPEFSDKDEYEYIAKYRETYIDGSWTGAAASNGSA